MFPFKNIILLCLTKICKVSQIIMMMEDPYLGTEYINKAKAK